MQSRPNKKADKELYALLKKKIDFGEYIFLKHAKERQMERKISDLEALNILEGKAGCSRKRNKAKD